MLTLSRKVHQRIVIGKDIIVIVKAIGRERVSLSIDAPKDVRVLRQEVFDAIERQKEKA